MSICAWVLTLSDGTDRHQGPHDIVTDKAYYYNHLIYIYIYIYTHFILLGYRYQRASVDKNWDRKVCQLKANNVFSIFLQGKALTLSHDVDSCPQIL